ncbi:MAG: tetratricopeptide repeat protein [Pirellulaceae bacterium]
MIRAKDFGNGLSFLKRAFVVGLLFAVHTNDASAFQEATDQGAANKTSAADSKTADEKTKTSPETAAQREAVIATFVKEINDLTPGGIEKDKDLKEAVKTAAGVFIEDPTSALEQLERLRKAYPVLPPGSLLVAALHYSAGNRTEGQRQLEDAANSHPNLPTIYNAFARLAIADGRRTDAVVLLEKSRNLIDSGSYSKEETDFYDMIYRDAMADLMLLRNDFGKAREFLESLIASAPTVAKNYMRLAQVDFRQEKIDECLKHLEEFRKIVPETRVPELMLATLYSQVGLDTQSKVWVEKALAKYPGEKAVVIEYVDWMVAHERFDEASASLEKSKDLLAGLPGVLMLKGKIAFAQQKFEDAEKIFAEVRTSEPSNVEVSTMLAISMAELGDKDKLEKAVEIAKQNAQLQQQNPVTLSVLGWVLFKQNNLQAAGDILNRATQLSQGQLAPESMYYIAKFLEARGQKEQALQFVTRSLDSTSLFLYRKAALELKQQLAPTGDLTPPKK